VLLSPQADTRARLEAVLRRPGLQAIFCEDALSALAQVVRASVGRGPASCVLLLDQPATLAGLPECFEALPKFVELPIVWVFEPGPPVSLKDTPWEQALRLAGGPGSSAGFSAGAQAEPGLGRPMGEAPAPLPLRTQAAGKPSASEWVASATETWAMPGMPAGAKAASRTIGQSGVSATGASGPALRLTGEPVASQPVASQPVASQPSPSMPSLSRPSGSGFDAPDALAEATPQPKSSWLGGNAASGSTPILSDDELAMLLGPDANGSEGFSAPKG
jgi:hypothetical protein